jgi:diguanylate cyclase (GGDEF)-like protein
VLVAGRDPGVRSALVELLGPDVRAVQVDGAEAATDAGRAEPLDAALLDLTGHPGGLATLEALRADPGGAELPALVMGARADEAAHLRALALGADYLSPPCSATELRARLDHAIRRARSTRALRVEALTDPLTGLPNRRALEGRLHEELRRARRYRTPLSCVMADVDHLKPINDSLGHACGDQALQGMAAVLHAELRDTDFAARAGGDEFLILLPHTGAEEALVLAERVRRRLGTLRLGTGRSARPVGASFGVAQLADDGDGQAMVDAADQALYAAKRAGRGQVRLAEAPSEPRPVAGPDATPALTS